MTGDAILVAMTNLDMESPTPEAEGDLFQTDEEIVSEAPQPEESPEPEYDLLDIDETLAGKHVRVSVDGDEEFVPLDEALQGYQRTADYTRKTQMLAEERRTLEDQARLGESLQTDPGLTIQVLARQAGMNVEDYLGWQSQQQAQSQPTQDDPYGDEEDDYEFSDPADNRMRQQLQEERQARMALEERLDRRDADEVLNSAISGLQQQYGASRDATREVVRQAIEMQVGPEMFPMIYQSQQYQDLRVKAQARQEAQQQKAAEQQRRQQAAAGAAATVGSGASVNGPGTAVPNREFGSAREAIEAAFDEHGI